MSHDKDMTKKKNSGLYGQFKFMNFLYSRPFIHHFTGLFGTNTVTIS